MATAFNCNVRVYKGAPLVKGGTAVLWTGNPGIIPGQYRTYSSYSYTRENKNAIQIGTTIADLEDCNYIAFQNAAHGGKWYFAFIDRVIYINDNNTEIQFTVDPFPTFIGDTTASDYVYVIRNTVKGANDTLDRWVTEDYVPRTTGSDWHYSIRANCAFETTERVLYFVCKQHIPIADYIRTSGGNLPIQYILNPSQQDIEDILVEGANILACYLVPTGFNGLILEQQADMTLTRASLGSYRHNKLLSGVYQKVYLNSSQGTSFYDLNDFSNPNSVSFGVTYYKIPQPAIHIYPKDYKGAPENIAEGITLSFPLIPVSIPSVYTNKEKTAEIMTIVGSTLSTAVLGAMTGGTAAVPMAIAGAGVGAVTGLAGMAKNAALKKFEPMGITSINFPAMYSSKKIGARVSFVSPGAQTMNDIDDYFDYYGYAIDDVMAKAEVNTDNGAYLQTGSAWLHGSEADVEINARLMAGVKIIKSF